MKKRIFRFSHQTMNLYADGGFSQLKSLAGRDKTILLTDENVFEAHKTKFNNWNTIVLKAGEIWKVQETADIIIEQLLEMEADRETILVGIGGGVITDLAGYVASVFMRGISFGFVPTTLLAMVDASLGGKNGVNVGVYKNMIGTIRQPQFILYDTAFLKTLPLKEWSNGFAEIIKHAAIKNASMFVELEKHNIEFYQKKQSEIRSLINRNVLLKLKMVQEDEYEKGNRKLLNFGHTIGHALENQHELSHGDAISVGMVYAGRLSEKWLSFKDTARITHVLEQYGLPTSASFEKQEVLHIVCNDKKKSANKINFVLLQRIGKAAIVPLTTQQIGEVLT